MAKHRIEVTQVLRVMRWTTIEVEAESAADAISRFQDGEDIPYTEDQKWEVAEDLRDETYKEAAE